MLLSLLVPCASANWESVNLEIAVKGSKVLELTEESLPQAAQEHQVLTLLPHSVCTRRLFSGSHCPPGQVLVVWFYAPWCKQCKLLRDAFEEAAHTGVDGVTFARIDCVKYPKVKEAYQVRARDNGHTNYRLRRATRHLR